MEFCLNIEPHLQPYPKKNPGGDCFACATTAAINYLFPENKVTFDEVFEAFKDKQGHLCNSWDFYHFAFYALCNHQNDRTVDIYTDCVLPNFYTSRFNPNFYHFEPAREYTDRIEGLLRSGWVILTSISMSGTGPYDEKLMFKGTDHIVIVDGIKKVWVNQYDENNNFICASQEEFIHVVCSAKGKFWVKGRDWFRKYGAAAWWQIRKDDRTYIDEKELNNE